MHDDVMYLPYFSSNDYYPLASNIVFDQFPSISSDQPHYCFPAVAWLL